MTPFSAAVDEVIAGLRSELGSDVDVRQSLPTADEADAPSVAVLLLGASPRAVVREALHRRTPVDLDILVAVTAEGGQQADLLHGCLAGIERTGWVLQHEPTTATWWLAAGVAPRPTLRLSVPVLLERELDMPLVTELLQVTHDPRDPGDSRRTASAV